MSIPNGQSLLSCVDKYEVQNSIAVLLELTMVAICVVLCYVPNYPQPEGRLLSFAGRKVISTCLT